MHAWMDGWRDGGMDDREVEESRSAGGRMPTVDDHVLNEQAVRPSVVGQVDDTNSWLAGW